MTGHRPDAGRSVVGPTVAVGLFGAWTATAALYLLHPSWLPQPSWGLLTSTAAGLLVAATVVAIGLRMTPTEPTIMPAVATPYPRPAPEGFRPAAAPFASPAPSASPVPPPTAALASAVDQVDWSRFAPAGADEHQCPYCGSFRTALGGPGGTDGTSLTCTDCRHQTEHPEVATVTVRAWRHPRTGPDLPAPHT